MRKAAIDIRIGDIVDLECDKYADPDGDNPLFECEFIEVNHVERETPDCVVIGFEGFDLVGFPVSHRLTVIREGGPIDG